MSKNANKKNYDTDLKGKEITFKDEHGRTIKGVVYGPDCTTLKRGVNRACCVHVPNKHGFYSRDRWEITVL